MYPYIKKDLDDCALEIDVPSWKEWVIKCEVLLKDIDNGSSDITLSFEPPLPIPHHLQGLGEDSDDE